jgi:hypothetical protein
VQRIAPWILITSLWASPWGLAHAQTIAPEDASEQTSEARSVAPSVLDDPESAPTAEEEPDVAPRSTPEPEPEPAPEPEPEPAPEPAPSPAVASEPEAVADTSDGAVPTDRGEGKSKRTLGLGLLISGSGFVAIGATTAAIYGVGDRKCGGSCIGGALVAATGVAGVIVGAIIVHRTRTQALAIRRGDAIVLEYRPGRGVRF